MLLIYAHTISSRLSYICDFIFREQLGIEYRISNDPNDIGADSIFINYTETPHSNQLLQIRPHGLLSEHGIRPQEINCFQLETDSDDKFIAFFKNESSSFPFDLFSACFYLISRYEEYLPHEKDVYGRYAHENSLAYQNGFLNRPIINQWLRLFQSELLKINPALKFNMQKTKTIISYDIDLAWSYQHKGLVRNIGGWLKKPGLERIAVLFGWEKDPFDCYEKLNQLHEKLNQEVIYFFPMAKSIGQFDKNISPENPALQQLIKAHTSKYHIGLHPSWQSNEDEAILKDEKSKLEEIIGRKVNSSRQHYIKFNLPETYRQLIKNGIENEYSMGYGSINGFRASVASDFFWYDLPNETITSLRIYPFCFMDANSIFEQKQDSETSLKELNDYLSICSKYNGTCIVIFHNHLIGDAPESKNWKLMHQKFISLIL